MRQVGDSITRGHPLKGKDLLNNYPCRLQRALGEDKYEVLNFGAGGHTMLKPSPPVLNDTTSYDHRHHCCVHQTLLATVIDSLSNCLTRYWSSTQFTKAKASAPHMVLVMLGTNDAVKSVW